MSYVLLRVQNIEEAFPPISKRAQTRIAKASNMAVGQHWDANFKMRHFDAVAQQQYGYKPRSAGYLRRKARASGKTWRVKGKPDQDMVYSGQTLQDVRQRQMPRAFPTRVTITMPTPSYVQMRPNPKFRDAPNLGEELTRVSPPEVEELTTVYVVTAEGLLQQQFDGR
jgi:hypothetical protein